MKSQDQSAAVVWRRPSAPTKKPAQTHWTIAFAGYAGLCSRLWTWFQSKKGGPSGLARLQVVETVSLGEKRFVAVVNVDGRRFLIGGSAGNVALLTKLGSKEDFETVLAKSAVKPAAVPVEVFAPKLLVRPATKKAANSAKSASQVKRPRKSAA